MQYKVLSLIFAAATMVAGTPLKPYSYGPVCSADQVAVCCETEYGKADSSTCLVAGNPKRVHAFEKKCAAQYGGLDAYCCTLSVSIQRKAVELSYR